MDNYVWIRGEVIESVEFSHEIAGKKYWRTKISCERRSGRKDILPVILRKKADISVGDFVDITTGKNINYCVCWEKVAHAAKNLTAGERVCIKGFIQSRNYRKRKDDGFNIIPTIEISVLLLENPDGIKIAPISAPV